MEKFLRKVNRKAEHPVKLARMQVEMQNKKVSNTEKRKVDKEAKPKIEIIKP